MNSLLAMSCCVAVLCTLGCTGSEAPTPLAVRPLAKGGFTGITEARQELVKDEKRWKEIWAEHGLKSSAPLPQVDFTKEMVVVATLGRQRTGGYSIQVTGAETSRGKLKIYIKRTAPQPGAIAIQVLTAPFDFVALPKSELPPEFVDGEKPVSH